MELFETMGDYLEKHNPFAIKDGKNRVAHFEKYDEIYLFTLKEIRKYCKRGFVDFAVLFHHLTKFDDDTCLDMAAIAMKVEPILLREPIMIDWHNVGYHKDTLKAILRGLHQITETELDWTSFEYAFALFREYNNEINKTENEDGIPE